MINQHNIETDNNMDKRKRLVVLGGGESGVGAAILGKDKGMDVFLSDFGQIPERYRRQLDDEGIEWEQGQHTLDRILSADEVVKSPGIPPTAPVVRAIVEKGIPVISEIEMAGRFTDAKMVCITGSNGKTTTTLLTYHILREAGINVGLAGNVGRSLALQVARSPHDVYVIELSSFQLENMYEFKANIAVMLNITPDHLDRYDYKMDNYVKAKFRIIRNLTADDAFIFWQDDPVIQRQLEQMDTEARLFPFAEHEEQQSHAWVDDEGELVFDTSETSLKMPRAELSLNGLHNLYNSWPPAWRHVCSTSGKRTSAGLYPTSRVWSTVWSRLARSTASAISTTRKPPTSIPAGMPLNQCHAARCSSSEARTKEMTIRR